MNSKRVLQVLCFIIAAVEVTKSKFATSNLLLSFEFDITYLPLCNGYVFQKCRDVVIVR